MSIEAALARLQVERERARESEDALVSELEPIGENGLITLALAVNEARTNISQKKEKKS